MAVDYRNHLALILYLVPTIKDKVLIRRLSNVPTGEITLTPFDNSNQTAAFAGILCFCVLQDLSSQLIR
jgi:hypothetical protein